MKIEINHLLFKRILKTLQRISYTSGDSTQFNSFFLEAKKDCLVVFAKNQLMEVERIVPTDENLKVLSPGKIIVSAFVLNEIVQRTKQPICLESSEKTIAILRTKSYETKINLLDLDQFWNNVRFDVQGTQTSVSVEVLHNLFNRVGYAVLTKDGKPEFRGINLRTQDQNLVATATDGSRIARFVLFSFEEKLDTVLYPATIAEVARISELEKIEEIYATFGEKKVLFQIGKGIKLSSRILAGPKEFPNTEKHFLSSYETVVKCQKDELIDAIEKAGIIFKKEDIPSVVFRVEENQFFVSSLDSIEIGFFEQKIDVETIFGSNKKTTLQTKFVLNALKSLPGSVVVVSFSPEDGPVLFTNKDNDSLKALVLPVWI